jgi:hypothetical protein
MDRILIWDVVWESGPNTYAVRHVESGRIHVRGCDLVSASELARAWNNARRQPEEAQTPEPTTSTNV